MTQPPRVFRALAYALPMALLLWVVIFAVVFS